MNFIVSVYAGIVIQCYFYHYQSDNLTLDLTNKGGYQIFGKNATLS